MASQPLNGSRDGGVGMHQLPPIATLTRTNLRIAQSKASARQQVPPAVESATLHVEGTDTVVELGPAGAMVVGGDKPSDKDPALDAAGKDAQDKRDGQDEVGSPKGRRGGGRGRRSGGRGRQTKAVEPAKDTATPDVKQAEAEPPAKKGRGRKGPIVKETAEAPAAKKDLPPVDATQGTPQKDASRPTTADSAGQDRRSNKRKRSQPEAAPAATATATAPSTQEKKEAKATAHPVPKLEPALAPVEPGGSKPIKWQMGDLLWAKVSGHPWWPCMVSLDPFTDEYTRLKGDIRARRSYHVQFFGDEAERGWINETSTLPFEGKINFFKHAENEIENATKSNRAKVKELYKVAPNRRAAWEVGVTDGEEALPFSRQERLDRFTFVYEIPELMSPQQAKPKAKRSPPNGLKKRGRKRKSQESASNTDSDSSPRKTKKERDSSPPPPPRCSRPRVTQDVGSFELFCAKSRESVLDEHPEFSEEAVVEFLQQQWSVLTDKQRAKYRTKVISSASPTRPAFPPAASAPASASQGSPSSESTKRSPRVSKPSLKKLEAEEDERRFTELVAQKSRRQIFQAKTDIPDSPVSTEVGDGMFPAPTFTPTPHPPTPSTSSSCTTTTTVCEGTRRDSIDEIINSVAAGAGSIPIPSRPDIELFRLNTTCVLKREPVCLRCEEEEGELLECSGPCFGYYHLDCLDLPASTPAQDFKCPECQSGVHPCFACKKADPETKKCSVTICGRFYHEECVKKFATTRQEGKGFFCPLHVCATCHAVDNKNPKAFKGRLYRCLRCPVAYHTGDICVAAGSEHRAGFHIVCSSHFEPRKNHTHHTHINVSWCFLCSKGGTLLCCDRCPAAFHTDCLGINPPDGAWFCSTCQQGPPLLYGDIIWVKLGFYRWWPGEICHPRNVPQNIQDMDHSVGEFPVHFFGSNDYFWMHLGRVFLFHEGDKGSREGENNRLTKIFRKGVIEATEAYLTWKAAKECKEQQEQEKNRKKPPPFRFIKSNFPIGSVQIKKLDLAQLPRCECKPDESGRACHSDTDCLNRMLMYECRAELCPAGTACQNQRFQKREYPEVEPFKTQGKGWGLKTLVDIKKGQFIYEYVGELVDEEECHRRILEAHDNNITNFYMLTLDKNRIIDAGPRANLSRFMNHSCQPNCETQKWTVNGDVRVGLFALHDITAGSELTFNYNLECHGNEKTVCACGAPNCSGFLGVRPKAAVTEKVKEARKKKKKKKKVEITHEDECFRCGEGGKLVMCDRINCPKVYHIQCLNRKEAPAGGWSCPWHHCDVCGKLSKVLCSECPNSFCSKHAEGNIFLSSGSLICHEHDLKGLDLQNVDGDGCPLESSGESESSSEVSSTNSHNTEAALADADMQAAEEKKAGTTAAEADAEPLRLVPAKSKSPDTSGQDTPRPVSRGRGRPRKLSQEATPAKAKPATAVVAAKANPEPAATPPETREAAVKCERDVRKVGENTAESKTAMVESKTAAVESETAVVESEESAVKNTNGKTRRRSRAAQKEPCTNDKDDGAAAQELEAPSKDGRVAGKEQKLAAKETKTTSKETKGALKTAEATSKATEDDIDASTVPAVTSHQAAPSREPTAASVGNEAAKAGCVLQESLSEAKLATGKGGAELEAQGGAEEKSQEVPATPKGRAALRLNRRKAKEAPQSVVTADQKTEPESKSLPASSQPPSVVAAPDSTPTSEMAPAPESCPEPETRATPKSRQSARSKAAPAPAASTSPAEAKPDRRPGSRRKSVTSNGPVPDKGADRLLAQSADLAPVDHVNNEASKAVAATRPHSTRTSQGMKNSNSVVAEPSAVEAPIQRSDGVPASKTSPGSNPGKLPSTSQVSEIPQESVVPQDLDSASQATTPGGGAARATRQKARKNATNAKVNGEIEPLGAPQPKLPVAKRGAVSRRPATAPAAADGSGRGRRKSSRQALRAASASPPENGIGLLMDGACDEDSLAVGPMFDDSEDDVESALVIDIPPV